MTCFDSVKGKNAVTHNAHSHFHIIAIVFDVTLLVQSAVQPPHTSNTFIVKEAISTENEESYIEPIHPITG